MNKPLVPESLVERAYEKVTDGAGNSIKQKDINRSPNVTERLEEYILSYNATLPEESKEKLVWVSDNLTNKQRQKRAKSIIRDMCNKHLHPDWLDGSITFNSCQLEHGKEIEACITEVASLPLMVVYAQSERNWAIRRLMDDVFSARRKTYLRKQKSQPTEINQPKADTGDHAEEVRNELDTEPDVQHNHQAPLTENEAVVASKNAFNSLQQSSLQIVSRDDTEVAQAQESEPDQLLYEATEDSDEEEEDIDIRIAILQAEKERARKRKRTTPTLSAKKSWARAR